MDGIFAWLEGLFRALKKPANGGAVLAMISFGIATEDQADTLCGVAVPGEKE